MDIEFATDHICRSFLKGLDPGTNGVVLEIGLGSGNFSFEWAAPLGFRCLAVEPLPTEALLRATNLHDVDLIKVAMGAKSGQVSIYHGELHGRDLPDISSLNPRWWGVTDRQSTVPCLTLPELCSAREIDQIVLLKVDTEGSEGDILSLLPLLPSKVLPCVIVVEYGGGGQTLQSKKGGWAPEFFEGTRRLLEVARTLGYSSSVVLETIRILPKWRKGFHAFDDEVLFSPNFSVGNLILIHDPQHAQQFEDLIRSLSYTYIRFELQQQLQRVTYILNHWFSRVRRKFNRHHPVK